MFFLLLNLYQALQVLLPIAVPFSFSLLMLPVLAVYLFVWSQLRNPDYYLSPSFLVFGLINFMIVSREFKLHQGLEDVSISVMACLMITYLLCRSISRMLVGESNQSNLLEFLRGFLSDVKRLLCENDPYLEFFSGKLLFLFSILVKLAVESSSFTARERETYEIIIDLLTLYFS